MTYTLTVLSIAAAIAVGAMSPGPSFVMVARISIASRRENGMAAAFGMGVGAVIFAAVALLGLQALFASVPWLYLGIKILGGSYLIYLGYRIWRGAKGSLMIFEESAQEAQRKLRRSFLLGLSTQLSNPKTAIVYGGIFASLLPREISTSLFATLLVVVFVIEAGWYGIVAFVLSSASPRATYLRSKKWIDRVAGTVMVLLGVRLVASASQR